MSVEQYLSTLVQMLKTVGLFGVSRCRRGGGKAGILHSLSQLSMGGLLKENLVPLVAQEDDHVHLKHLRSLWELAGVLLDPRLSKRQKRRKTAASQLAEAHRSKLQREEMCSIEFTHRRLELEALRLHLLPGFILSIWL